MAMHILAVNPHQPDAVAVPSSEDPANMELALPTNFSLDKSAIPKDKLSDPRLKAMEASFLDQFSDEGFRLRVCLHEAAHAVYMERAGAKIVLFHGPLARYDSVSDVFYIGGAGAQADYGDVVVNSNAFAQACIYAAGGVALEKMTSQAAGDESDFEDFATQAKSWGFGESQIQEWWQEARKQIAKDLRKPAFRRLLWDRAREYRKCLEEMGQPKDI